MSDGRVKRELRRGTAWSPGMPCAAPDSGALLLAVLQQVDPTEPLAHGVLTADHTPVHRDSLQSEVETLKRRCPECQGGAPGIRYWKCPDIVDPRGPKAK